jgi:two-component system chemotaxis sensor kinase CheA
MTVFEPQFSTRTEVTELSGRGVGLDAVKHEVEKIGGTVDLESTAGKGTTFIFRLPLQSAAVLPLKPGKPLQFETGSDSLTMSDLVLEARGPR